MKKEAIKWVSVALGACVMLASAAAQATAATYSTPYFDVAYDTTQLSSNWIFNSSGTTYFATDLQPAGGQFALELSPIDRATLGSIDLTFTFKGPVAQPAYNYTTNEVVMWDNVINPSTATFSTVSSYMAPADGSIFTAYGHDTLTVSSGADQASTSKVFIATAYGSTSNTIAGPWSSAPDSNGSWAVHITQNLLGSIHLVPSMDGICASVLCMPAERAAVGLNNLRINFGYSSIVSTVPEPQTYAMMLAGLALMGFMALRRAARLR